MSDLWPDFDAESIKSPKSIMSEHASALKDKTKGKLSARVTQGTTSGSGGPKILLRFMIISPTLGNYKFSLFYITHTIEGYPLDLWHDKTKYEINSEEELLDRMKIIFNSEETKTKITTLMSYE